MKPTSLLLLKGRSVCTCFLSGSLGQFPGRNNFKGRLSAAESPPGSGEVPPELCQPGGKSELRSIGCSAWLITHECCLIS